MTPNDPKMEPKVVPKWSREGHQTPKNTGKLILWFWVAPELQNGPQNDPKIIKKQILGPFFSSQKNMISQVLFFLVFLGPRRSQTLKIKSKRCNDVQKRGCHLFMKKPFLYAKMSKNDRPKDPRKLSKTKKTRKKEPPETAPKKTRKKHWNRNLS